MDPLTKDQEFEVIDNITKAGKDTDVDFGEVIRSINRMLSSQSYNEPKSETLLPREFFDKFHSISPQQFIDYTRENYDVIKEETGVDNYSIDILLNSLNKSGLMPYKALKRGNVSEGEQEWGFFKEIEGYELAEDGNKNDVYLKKYKDGTIESIDKETFDNEKYFRFLPDNIKKMMMVPIDENTMNTGERMKMNKKILEHQAKYLASATS